MKHQIARFGLPGLILALLLLAGIPGGARLTDAAPLAAITGTPIEPPPPVATPFPPSPTLGEPPVAPTPTKSPSSGNPAAPVDADPAITKSASAGEARVGDEITFTISVTNNGPATANDVVVSDPVAPYLDILDVTASRGSVATSGNIVTVTIGAVAQGEVVTIRIRTRVNEQAQPPAGRNATTLTTTSPGDNPDNNYSEVTFTIVGQPTATISPTVSPTPMIEMPAELPRTGGESAGPNVALLAVALGALGVALGVALRRRVRG